MVSDRAQCLQLPFGFVVFGRGFRSKLGKFDVDATTIGTIGRLAFRCRYGHARDSENQVQEVGQKSIVKKCRENCLN